MKWMKADAPWWKKISVGLLIMWMSMLGSGIGRGDFRWPGEKGEREEKDLRIVNGVLVKGWTAEEIAALERRLERSQKEARVLGELEALPDAQFQSAMNEFWSQLEEFNASVASEVAGGEMKPERARALAQSARRFESRWKMYESARKKRMEQAELVGMKKEMSATREDHQ
jgi:hypothetical protein